MVKKNITTAQIYAVKTLEELTTLAPSFEEVYGELENIIKKQEDPTTSLSDNISFYKLGKIFVAYCQNILQNAENEIENIN
jgi:exodeoxyribonuclease VII small subunit